jgi:hypothetical protein
VMLARSLMWSLAFSGGGVRGNKRAWGVRW